jgi:hypothetical protein
MAEESRPIGVDAWSLGDLCVAPVGNNCVASRQNELPHIETPAQLARDETPRRLTRCSSEPRTLWTTPAHSVTGSRQATTHGCRLLLAVKCLHSAPVARAPCSVHRRAADEGAPGTVAEVKPAFPITDRPIAGPLPDSVMGTCTLREAEEL